jgi:hypothetical protein
MQVPAGGRRAVPARRGHAGRTRFSGVRSEGPAHWAHPGGDLLHGGPPADPVLVLEAGDPCGHVAAQRTQVQSAQALRVLAASESVHLAGLCPFCLCALRPNTTCRRQTVYCWIANHVCLFHGSTPDVNHSGGACRLARMLRTPIVGITSRSLWNFESNARVRPLPPAPPRLPLITQHVCLRRSPGAAAQLACATCIAT